MEVDQAKIDTIAALDADNLAFMADLEASGYSEAALMKWYWHPIIGPRIRSGAFLDPTTASGLASAVSATLGGPAEAATAAAMASVVQQARDEQAGGADAGGGSGGSAAPGLYAAASVEVLMQQLLSLPPGQAVPQDIREAMLEALAPVAAVNKSLSSFGSSATRGAAAAHGGSSSAMTGGDDQPGAQ